MKRLRKAKLAMSVSLLIVFASLCDAQGSGTDHAPGDGVSVNTTDVLNTDQTQIQSVFGPGYANAASGDAYAEGGEGGAGGEGGDASSIAYSGGSSSGAIASLSTTSISKSPKIRIPPLSVIPPYLPYWTHGGWGAVNAYFPNGPSSNDTVYERTFNPHDPDDMRDLRGVFDSLSYSGLLEALGGVFNSVRVVFGGPDNFHHGKGFEIANAFIRDRRPEGKPLLMFIDSNVDRKLLNKAGYAYVGKVSLEGEVDRNWDQVYDAAVAEALPWDVDVLLISGGMKGVTVGSNISFPGAGYGYSQTNYSLSLFGATSSGITEGKGKAMVSAEGYRYWPQALIKRRIPKALYDRIHAKPPSPKGEETAQEIQQPTTTKQQQAGVKVSRELFELAGFEQSQVQNLIIE